MTTISHSVWSCWCVTDGGCRSHKHYEQACPDCGRLQPPRYITSLIMGRSHDMTAVIAEVHQCMPNPDDKKLID